MEIKLLGPFDVWLNGEPIAPTAAKLRQVFALLAMRAGRLITVSTLVEELWGPEPPQSATCTIQTYILGLRRRIGKAMPSESAADPKHILRTRPAGYVLDVQPETVDVHRYLELAAVGERAFVAGDFESASRVLHRALAIWRGPALMDTPRGMLLEIEVTRLEQSRLAVLESRIEADLHLGRHHELLGELAELVARYPMHEKLCTQYMTALSVSGLKWRALEVFWGLRKTLVRELGVEPSLQVQRLQRAILNSDPVLEAATFWPVTASG